MEKALEELHLQEKIKYEKMWNQELYRKRSPGLLLATFFLYHIQDRVKVGDSILDFGCGTGAASLLFFEKGLDVTLVDIANNCLSPIARDLVQNKTAKFKFIEASLWDLPQDLNPCDWIYCIDVLEHLPEPKLMEALQSMAKKTKKGGALQVFLEDETMGESIGEKLHLSIYPLNWWIEKISSFWKIEHVQEIIPNLRYCIYVGSPLINPSIL